MLDIIQICVAKLIKIEGRSIGAENEERADITVVSELYELWAACGYLKIIETRNLGFQLL